MARGGWNLLKMLRSKKGISPILATLLLIVIAVAAIVVTYAWVMTYMSGTTSHAGEQIVKENVNFYGAGTKINITIRNIGTADSKIVSIRIGTSPSNLVLQTDVTPSLPKVISVGSSEVFTVNYPWTDETRYYFKIFTESGKELTFDEKA